MTEIKNKPVSFDDFDDFHYPRVEKTDFNQIVDAAISRRSFITGTITLGASAFIMGTSTHVNAKENTVFDFTEIATDTSDTITLPEGYTWEITTRWGDPLWSAGQEFDQKTRGTGKSQELAIGDNNDGMSFFEKNGKTILVINNEYANVSIIHGNRQSGLPKTEDDIRKSKAAHGLSVCEIKKINGKWQIVSDSPINRRITADSKVKISGPAAGHDLLKTEIEPSGLSSFGTWANCGNGETPWGTYLTCEENFNAYYASSDPEYIPTKAMERYGIGHKDWGYNWRLADERFDISKHPNEANKNGYIVEIDPWNPASTPVKRTALGRIKHENAEVVVAKNGHVVVYMGDDERGEYLYRFVTDKKYSPDADNSDLLDNGTLSVALFNTDNTGKWIDLTPETTGMPSQAEICIHTRLAASVVGATTMDRPEWVAAHPHKTELYCALTNNKYRGIKPNRGGDATPVEGANPRKENLYGQIVQWTPENEDHTSENFNWKLYAVAGNPLVHSDDYAGSSNINSKNLFNSPDGLSFDSKGRLWLQTDGDYSNMGDFKGMGNNQMLVGNPETGEIRRFMVGPNEAEITGLCWSTDKKTMFVGIQHPGEKGNSNFPDGGNTVPRSCVIAVKRLDGKEIG